MNDVICGDCLDVMSGMPAGSVDLVVTSPPYADRRKKQYGGIPAGEYVKWFMPRASGMRRALRERGSLVIVIKEHTVEGERSEYVMDLVRAMRRGGWKWIDNYMWLKPNPPPGKWPARLKDGWEQCMHFSPTVRPSMYRDNVARPAAKRTVLDMDQNAKHDYEDNEWASGSDSFAVNRARVVKSMCRDKKQYKSTGSRFNYNYSHDDNRMTALPSNVIEAAVGEERVGHPASFPVAVPDFFIRLFTKPGDTVLDPFCGSGTTLLAAAKLGRKYIGIDTSAEYCEMARRRVAKVQQVMEASE